MVGTAAGLTACGDRVSVNSLCLAPSSSGQWVWGLTVSRLTLGTTQSHLDPEGLFEACMLAPAAPPWKVCSKLLVLTRICKLL